MAGSSDLYEHSGRRPFASINFVTAHDGFTLRDLVSYNEKHNEANGEDNRDGNNHNLSWNCGVEGPTGDPTVLALRARQMRNLLATLLLSQGVPMLLAGDERGHTQNGNNNAYCQDNERTWLDWSPDEEREALTTFVSRVIALRRMHPSFRRRGFFVGQPPQGSTVKDVCWLRPDGAEMTPEDWNDGDGRALAMLVSGLGITDCGPRGEAVRDDDFLLLFSASNDDLDFMLPTAGPPWHLLLDTATGALPPEEDETRAVAPTAWTQPSYRLESRSFVLLTRAARPGPEAPAVPAVPVAT